MHVSKEIGRRKGGQEGGREDMNNISESSHVASLIGLCYLA
jgi:hypothetical protein